MTPVTIAITIFAASLLPIIWTSQSADHADGIPEGVALTSLGLAGRKGHRTTWRASEF